MDFFIRGRIPSEERNPVSKVLMWLYEPLFWLSLRGRFLTILAAVALVAVTYWPYSQLGSEFMPPLEEGDLLYMPTADPSISITKARELLQQTDKLIQHLPRGAPRLRQGRPGRHPDRPGRPEHDGDHDHPAARQGAAGASGTSSAGSRACPAG